MHKQDRPGRAGPGADTATGPQVAVVFGVSGCGKTEVGRRLAEVLGWDFMDADDLHPPGNIQKMRSGIPLDDNDRFPWLDILRARLQAHLEAGRPVVLGCSALKQVYRDRLTVDPQKVRFVFLKTPREELERRLQSRQHHFFDPRLLDSQLSTLEEPGAEAIIVETRMSLDEVVAAARLGLFR